MYNVKAIALIVFLISALTAASLIMSRQSEPLTAQRVESVHLRTQGVIREKLVNAEQSMMLQAADLANNAPLTAALADVRSKLIVTTPDDLKKQTSNKWNLNVFNALIDWKQQRESALKLAESGRMAVEKSDSGSMIAQYPTINWWNKTPSLVLAFANVPLKNAQISATLVANGIQGKELQAGKRYDEDVPTLAAVCKDKTPQFGHFPWEGELYLAVAMPIVEQDELIGTVVVGYSLNNDLLAYLHRNFSEYIDLMLMYSSPRFDQDAQSPKRKNIGDLADALKTGNFHVNSDRQTENENVAYDKIPANAVYTNFNSSDHPIAISRLRWVWDDDEETDIYISTNMSRANASIGKLQIKIITAGILTLIVGVFFTLLIMAGIKKNNNKIRKAIANAITTGEPIDSEAMAVLLDGSADTLPQYSIKEIIDEEDLAAASGENWNKLMNDDSVPSAAAASSQPASSETADNSDTSDMRTE